MAVLDVGPAEVRVRLNLAEKLGALRGDVRVPRRCVANVRVTDDPFSEVRGMRLPGTAVPGVVSLGVRRGSFGRDFVAVYRRHRVGVVVELEDAPFKRLVISADNAEALVRRLENGNRGGD